MGKTLIDTELRNNIVDFLGSLDDRGDGVSAKAADLYSQLKPKRIRKARALTIGTEVNQ